MEWVGTRAGWALHGVAIVVALAPRVGAAHQQNVLDALPAALRTGPTGVPLDEAQTLRLSKGEVLSALTPGREDDVPLGVAVGLIDAAPAGVLRTLRDYAHFRTSCRT